MDKGRYGVCGVNRWRPGSRRAWALDLLAGSSPPERLRTHVVAMHRTHFPDQRPHIPRTNRYKQIT